MVNKQLITDNYAIYQGNAIQVLPSIPDKSVHLTCYSPPFAGLYQYSSHDNDLSNCASYEQFLEHYRFVIREIARITIPGRLSCVHVTDVPKPNGNNLTDFPGDVVRLHEQEGMSYHGRFNIWKEPLRVAIRTRVLSLRHSQIVKDAVECRPAGADYILLFQKKGVNPIPVSHERGLQYYAGSNPVPDYLKGKYGSWSALVEKYKDWEDPKTNKMAHVIWQRYASPFWDDIRIDNVLKYREARENEEEKHVHPLQLDVVDRCVELYTNPGETCVTPFMGVGTEVYSPCSLGRKAIGIELKETYFNQGVENLKEIKVRFAQQLTLI